HGRHGRHLMAAGYRVESYAGGGRWAIIEVSTGRMIKSGYRSRDEAVRAMDRLPAPSGTRSSSSTGGADVDFGAINAIAGGIAGANYAEELDRQAWQVINGTWPPGSTPGAEVMNRVGEIQRYLAGIEASNAAAAG